MAGITPQFVFDGTNLQTYIKERKAQLTQTKPGYEIYFYSRFDTNTLVSTNGTTGSGPGGNVSQTTGLQSFQNITPTFAIRSSPDQQQISYVTSIEVHQSVTEDGSSATVTLVNPPSDFFATQLGVGVRDYDASGGVGNEPLPHPPPHRIGVMDTILIKLTNLKDNSNDPKQRETVFRGVISKINRVHSTEGDMVVLECKDFSEFLRRAMAVKTGIFSTISISLTGRGLVYNGVNYVNALLNGNKSIFGVTLTPEQQTTALNEVINAVNIAKIANSGESTQGTATAIDDITATQLAANDKVLQFDAHAMAVPPLIYLEFSEQVSDMKYASGALGSVPQILNDIAAVSSNGGSDLSALNNLGSANSIPLTPEDQDSTQFYQVASAGEQQTLNNSQHTIVGLQKLAWTLSDLYLEKGIITFEHQYIWDLCTQTASRALREVFFDFKPKLQPGATTSWLTATVDQMQASQASGSAATSSGFQDLHPNIGILKYRLSPCFIPYRDGTSKPATKIMFWQYLLKDEDIISYQGVENEENVFTMVLGYGTGINKNTTAESIMQLGFTESNQFAPAQSIDPLLEKRLGYRFMSDHDAKLSIPILKYFVSYVQLMKSQLGMFSQTVVIPGRPDIQPGSIVYLEAKNADYYCTSVSHAWNLGGYRTILSLNYGHHHGKLPSGMTGSNLAILEPTLSNQQCDNNKNQMDPYVANVPKMIGNVNVECLAIAIWNFWCGATTNLTTIAQKSREYQNTHNALQSGTVTPGDWIRLTANGGYSNTYDGLFQANLVNSGLNQYGITVNAIKNLVGHESSYVPTAVSPPNKDGSFDYGLFQINFQPPGATTMNGLTISQAENPTSAASYAFQLLQQKVAIVVGSNPPTLLSGKTYLNVFQAYNGSLGDSSYAYCNAVFGADQVQAILAGTQTPTGVQAASAASSAANTWPYYCYGPLGIRVAQSNPGLISVNPAQPTAAYTTEKTNLLGTQSNTVTYGMTQGINYLVGVLQRLQNQNVYLAVNGTETDPFTALNIQQNLLSKAIAAWFTNEIQNSYDPSFSSISSTCQNAINQITSFYNSCLQCVPITTYSIANPPQNSLQLLNNGHIMCRVQSDVSDLLNFCHPSIVSILEQLVSKNYYIYVTYVATDHPDDGAGHSHSKGYAVDCWPCNGPFSPSGTQGANGVGLLGTPSNFMNPTDQTFTQFLRDVAACSGLYQIGLGGTSQTSANFAAAGSTCFTDNGQDHIHIGGAYDGTQ